MNTMIAVLWDVAAEAGGARPRELREAAADLAARYYAAATAEEAARIAAELITTHGWRPPTEASDAQIVALERQAHVWHTLTPDRVIRLARAPEEPPGDAWVGVADIAAHRDARGCRCIHGPCEHGRASLDCPCAACRR